MFPRLRTLTITIPEPSPPSRLRLGDYSVFPTSPFPASRPQLLVSRPKALVQQWFSKEMLSSSKTLWLAAILVTLWVPFMFWMNFQHFLIVFVCNFSNTLKLYKNFKLTSLIILRSTWLMVEMSRLPALSSRSMCTPWRVQALSLPLLSPHQEQ